MAVRPVFIALCLAAAPSGLFFTNSPACSDERKSTDQGSQPVVEIAIPNIQHVYEDLKLLFDLARDGNGYKTFKDTFDEFLVGIDAEGPCGIRMYATPDGLSTVISAPVKDEAALHKFVMNLWDLDVKSAPPPSPQLQRQVPKSVQDKLQSLKPRSNERILFKLMDGALRYDKGYVHLGKSLDAVRLPRAGLPELKDKSSSVAIHIRGDLAPAQRHAAFDKSKQDLLSRPKRENYQSEAEFNLAVALADFELARIELLVADSSQVNALFSLSRSKKAAQFDADVAAAGGTTLARIVSGIGKRSDQFAGVSSQNAVVAATVNMPLDPSLAKLFDELAKNAREAANEKTDASSRLDAQQKQIDREFADLIFDVATDIAGMDTFNGVLRTWVDGEGRLTTVGAARISHGGKIRERIQKFKHHERVQQSAAGVELYRLINTHWQQDAPELFDNEGAVYVGASDEAVWFATGNQALDRLHTALESAPKGKETAAQGGAAAQQRAVDLRADLRPLAQVWDAVRSRQAPTSRTPSTERSAPRPAAKVAPGKSAANPGGENDTRGERKNTSNAISTATISDLQLHKIAGESFREKDGRIEISLSREGENAKLHVQCDEGVLRFLGMTLSKFTQQNLAD